MVKKAAATVATKRKDNAETLVVVVATVQKTLDKTWTRERVVALAWEKEMNIACHLEQQLVVVLRNRASLGR
jgi:hypothetical protein